MHPSRSCCSQPQHAPPPRARLAALPHASRVPHHTAPVARARRRSRRPHANLAACASTGAGPVLVQDRRLVPAPATAQQLLAAHRDSSYTTALVRGGHLVVDWRLHLQRLARNIEVLAAQRPPAYAPFTAWLGQQAGQGQGQAAAAADVINQLVAPAAAQALQQLACQGAATSDQQAMLAVVVTDPLGGSQEGPGGAAGSAPSCAPEAPGSGPPPLSVLVWAKALPQSPAPSPANVLVAGAPRPSAHAKHCDWVVARQPLEALGRAQGADEVVLQDSGALLEGLVTNLHVIADAAQVASLAGDGGQGAAEALAAAEAAAVAATQQAAAAGGLPSGLVLLTPGPQHSALQGIMQQRVVQACQQLGLPVLRQPARLGQQGAWRAALLTNCIKGMWPVQQMRLPDGQLWEAPAGSSAVTDAIARAVADVQEDVDVRQLAAARTARTPEQQR